MCFSSEEDKQSNRDVKAMGSLKKFLILIVVIVLAAVGITTVAVFISNSNKTSTENVTAEETTSPVFTINTLCWRAEIKTSYSNVIDSSFFSDCGTNSDVWTVTSFESKKVNSNVDSQMEVGGVYVTPVTENQMQNLGVISVEDLVSYEDTSDYYYEPSGATPVQMDGQTGYVSVLGKSSWKYGKKIIIGVPDIYPYVNSSGEKIAAFIIYFMSNETVDAADTAYNSFVNSWVWVN